MKRYLCPGIFAVVVPCVVVSWAQVAPEKPKMVPIVEDYTDWKLVNAEPAAMDAAVAVMCAPAPPPMPANRSSAATAVMGSGGPHEKKWINVFVNSTGETAMLTQKFPRFPQGTVIVKQKLAIPPSKGKDAAPAKPAPGQQPELLTIMIKREAGYDRADGDWEWMVTDGTGTKIVENGQLEPCQDCHRPFGKTDSVVRSYLPASVVKALQDDAPPSQRNRD